MKRICLFIVSVCLFFSSALADGTRQFMPNQGTDDNPQHKGNCYLNIAAQEGGETSGNPSRNFARYDNTGVSCDTTNALFINIRDPENEVIHFGLGNAIWGSHSISDGNKNSKVKVRIKDPCGNVIWPVKSDGTIMTEGITIEDLKDSTYGNITSYAKAYYGPKSVDSRGYDYFSIKPDATKCDFSTFRDKAGDINCNFRIEFNNGSNLGAKTNNTQIYFDYFDVCVVNTEGTTTNGNGKITSGKGTLKEGRLWSYAWGLTTNGSSNQTHTTFYTISNDHYVSKVYLNGWEPYQFVVACNSFGSQNTGKVDEDRKSKKPATDPSPDLPEYKIFLTQPHQEEWGEAHVPNVPDKLTFAGDAITCEDLIFVVKLLYNENATLELYMDTDGDKITDKVIAALLQANIIKDRGFHYPWKDQTELKVAGQGVYNYTPASEGCTRHYTLSLFDQSYFYTYKDKDGKDSTTRINSDDTIKYDPFEPTFAVYYNSANNEIVKGVTKEGDTYVFDDRKFEPNEPVGSEKNPIIITTKDQLEDMAQAIANCTADGSTVFEYTIDDYYIFWNKETGEKITKPRTFSFDAKATDGFDGIYFYLTAPTGSITLDAQWIGIGSQEYPFKGTFRSGRFNKNPTAEADSRNASNTNSGDQDTIILNTKRGLFSFCEGATIENIHVKGNIFCNDNSQATHDEISDLAHIGGICDYAENTLFSHCTNDCNITYTDNTFTNVCIGGILGTGDGCTIDSCFNYGNITSTNYILATGGIVAYLLGSDDDNINFCYNLGTINSPSFYCGGIAGTVVDIDIKNCRNDGSILSIPLDDEACHAAGIVGEISTSSRDIIVMHSCVNNGNISSSDVAGITTINDESIDITYCMNTGELNTIDGGTISPIAPRLYISNSISTQPAVYINNDPWNAEYTPVLITDENKADILESLIGYEEIISEITTIEVVDYYEEVEETDTRINEETGDEEPYTYIVEVPHYTTVNDTTFEIRSVDGREDSPFMLDSEGKISSVATACCGEMLRIEDAGRLFDSKTTFYIKWDGKDEAGDCVTGNVTVNYQKNSGVTHFPFYDPENNKKTSGQGLIVYRISPIQDSVTKFDDAAYWESTKTDGKEGASAYQRAKYGDCHTTTCKAIDVYGYQKLPKDYYQTKNYSDEMGIELKLFWDDRNISLGSSCTNETYPYGGKNWSFGKTDTQAEMTSVCTQYKNCKKTKKSYDYKTGKNITYCTEFKSGYSATSNCITYTSIQLKAASSTCMGITNVDSSGYFGSQPGGHLFPKEQFGNTNIINTWWNGVEVKQLVPLTLTAHEPALLHNDQIYGILPITISRWNAYNQEKSVLLEWSTASEENNDYFTIERSINGVSWGIIGKVKGAGTTTMESYYSFEDKKPLGGISYYRLKQTDYNGEYSYSSVKCINRPDNANDNFIVYTKQDANAFIVEGEVIAACPIEIYNTAGSRIYNVSFNTLSVNKVLINVNDLPAGTYFVKICNGSKAVVKNW